ncbi:MAG: SRPBCC family protein, partial [Acetobacteraceae bacterium]
AQWRVRSMEMTGERHISAPRQKVWEALNDPAVLKSAIPGCESLEKISENELKATASVRIGPIAARFAGKVLLSDLDPPNSYTISGEGQGGVAGFAKGGATVHLADAGSDTLLQYDVKAQVGGKIAQLGARLIDASAKQMADNFFDRFAASVGGVPEVAVAGAREIVAREAGERARAPAEPLGMPLVVWIAGVVCIVIIILVLGTYL